MDNPDPCQGLYKIRKDVIYHYSSTCIYLWNVNKFHNLVVDTR